MTKTETVKLLAVISAAYPNMQVTEATVEIWHELLGDLGFNIVLTAAKKLILESPYPPTIADIRKRAVEVMTPLEDRLDAAEAWGEVMRALRVFGYYREAEALQSMSPRTAKVVRWMGWSEICLSEELGVARGQFMKMYQQVAEREHKEQLLPAMLRNDIKKIASKFSLKLLEVQRNEKV